MGKFKALSTRAKPTSSVERLAQQLAALSDGSTILLGPAHRVDGMCGRTFVFAVRDPAKVISAAFVDLGDQDPGPTHTCA
jgi:hypothetical protein